MRCFSGRVSAVRMILDACAAREQYPTSSGDLPMCDQCELRVTNTEYIGCMLNNVDWIRTAKRLAGQDAITP